MKQEFKNSHWYKILSELADQLHEKWAITTALEILPVVWVVVYQVKMDWFVDPNGNLKAMGIIIAVICCFISFFLILVSNFKSSHELMRRNSYEETAKRNEAEVVLRSNISSAESSIDERYLRLLKEYIDNNEFSISVLRDFIKKAYDPVKRINAVLDELSYCFEKISKIPRDRIFLSAAVRISSKDWEWISQIQLSGTATLDELLNSHSLFAKVAKEGIPFAFANDKKKALKKKYYYWDKKDESTSGQGSIICWEIAQSIRNIPVRMIISISTYGEPFYSNENASDEDVKKMYEEVIKDTILCRFEGRLSEALIMYALLKRVI